MNCQALIVVLLFVSAALVQATEIQVFVKDGKLSRFFKIDDSRSVEDLGIEYCKKVGGNYGSKYFDVRDKYNLVSYNMRKTIKDAGIKNKSIVRVIY